VEHAFEAAGAAHTHADVVFLITGSEIESTECGVASARFSLVSAAAVTCAIMKPELRPGSGVRNAGSMLVSGLVICFDAAARNAAERSDGELRPDPRPSPAAGRENFRR